MIILELMFACRRCPHSASAIDAAVNFMPAEPPRCPVVLAGDKHVPCSDAARFVSGATLQADGAATVSLW